MWARAVSAERRALHADWRAPFLSSSASRGSSPGSTALARDRLPVREQRETTARKRHENIFLKLSRVLQHLARCCV
jgi:hypothetical protein